MLQNNLDVNLDLLTSGLSSKFDRIAKKVNISGICRQDFENIITDAKRKKTWALHVLNSWGQFPPSGAFTGTLTSFGSFEQCLNSVPSNMSSHANYCTVTFSPLLPFRPKYHKIVDKLEVFKKMNSSRDHVFDDLVDKLQFLYYVPIRIGTCLPSSCSLSDVSIMTREVGAEMFLFGEAIKCESRQSFEVESNIYRRIGGLILLFIIAIVVIASVYDLFQLLLQNNTVREENINKMNCNDSIEIVDSFGLQILRAFSIVRNTWSLFDTRNSTYQELKCLNGIRVLTISWIIVGHAAASSNYQGFTDSFKALHILTSPLIHGLLNASLTVESFFLISGILTSYVTLKSVEATSKFSPSWFVFARYLRLTPTMVCAICFVYFLPYLGSGPIWNEKIQPMVQACEKNWWINLIYLQPYIDPQNMCIIPTWWLANDMFFHVISLAIVLPLIKKPKLGFIINLLFLIGFALVTFVYSLTHDYPVGSIPTRPHFGEYLDEYAANYFWRPYLHGPPFFIGIQLGYLLAQGKYLKATKVQVLMGWILSLSLMVMIIYGAYPISLGYIWPRWALALFDSTNRIIWSLALAWMIYAMASGYGGWFDSFLSHRYFAPMSKTSYSVYLIHMFVITVYTGSQLNLLQTTSISLINAMITIWVVSMAFGSIWTLLFEAPFLNIMKLVFNLQRRSTKIVTQKSEEKINNYQRIPLHDRDGNMVKKENGFETSNP
ncbi:nose resistant to fluoxetine protein 6-like isoform X2 [Brevipalpus obovatus]